MLEVIQILLQLVALAVFAHYTPKGNTRFRLGISMISGVLMSTLGVWTLALMFGRVDSTLFGVAVAGLIAFIALYCRGNVSTALELLKGVLRSISGRA